MHFLDLTLSSLAENLALDEAILQHAQAAGNGHMLRIWEWPQRSIVLGAAGILAEDVNEAACRAEGVPMVRRSSGGGTVLIGPGCLLYTLVLPYSHAPQLQQIASSYCYLFGRLIGALTVPGLQCAGVSDLAIGDRKVSGNSQQRKRTHLLQHGTLLYDFDLAQVGRYLRMPTRQPEYREMRSHGDFLANLPLPRAEIIRRIRLAFDAQDEAGEWPRDLVRKLVETKYGLPEWTRRRQ